MPWQSLGPLVVVGAMVNVAAGLVGGIHYVAYGVSSGGDHDACVWYFDQSDLNIIFLLKLCPRFYYSNRKSSALLPTNLITEWTSGIYI